MKRMLTIAALALAMSGGAQVIQEHNYTGQGVVAHLEFQDDLYAILDAPARVCRLYDANHALVKAINLPVPGGDFIINSVQHVTDGLFNTDEAIELTYTGYQIGQGSVEYESRVINEGGQLLVSVPGASAVYVDYLENDWKLLAWIYDYSVSPPDVETRVFSLPGHLVTETAARPRIASGALPYPNPAAAHIWLSYNLRPGTEGEMIISNTGGQVVKTLRLGPDYTRVQLSLKGMAPGLYFYNVSNGEGTGSFVVSQ